MQRDLVEARRWFTEAELQQALAVGQTMPGPLAAQAAMWFGYLQAALAGALAVAFPFVIPPFVIVTAALTKMAKTTARPAKRSARERLVESWTRPWLWPCVSWWACACEVIALSP